MAQLKIDIKKIQENIIYLGNYFKEKEIKWSLITKVFSGDREFLHKVLTPEVIQSIDSIGDSRLTSLRNLRAINPEMQTIYIKPPAVAYAEDIVKYADISTNTSFETISALNSEARKQGKIHKIVIMIEMGELREGVLGDDILTFYESVFNLSNIEVLGIGSNLGCMYGIVPTYDKLMQLVLYKELISAKFHVDLKIISGGTSITLPLLDKGEIPASINHFRVGEAAFFGVSPLDNAQFKNLHTDAFVFTANILELEEKNLVPDGEISDANIGHTVPVNKKDKNKTSNKMILDFGLLDVDQKDLKTMDPHLSFVGITSDMIVVDVGDNTTENGQPKYTPGESIPLIPNYLAVARLLNSKFIDKVFI